MSPKQVNSWRAGVRWAVRGVAATMVATGVYLMLKRLSFGIGTGNMEAALRSWVDIGESHSFYRGVALVIVGGALAALSTRLSAWIVTVPAETCPQCGYANAPAEGARCPECGLQG